MSELSEQDQAVIDKASRLGVLVREHEDAGREEDRRAARKDWTTLRFSLGETRLADLAKDSYWDAYCDLIKGTPDATNT